jgi:hypothetical protein
MGEHGNVIPFKRFTMIARTSYQNYSLWSSLSIDRRIKSAGSKITATRNPAFRYIQNGFMIAINRSIKSAGTRNPAFGGVSGRGDAEGSRWMSA